MDVYNIVRSQLIIGPMGDIVGLNYSAIIGTLELLEVKNKRNLFFAVIECFYIEQELLSRGKQ